MIALSQQDLLVLSLGLNLLATYTADQLAKARAEGNSAKVASMTVMHEQIAAVRTKVAKMQVPS